MVCEHFGKSTGFVVTGKLREKTIPFTSQMYNDALRCVPSRGTGPLSGTPQDWLHAAVGLDVSGPPSICKGLHSLVAPTSFAPSRRADHPHFLLLISTGTVGATFRALKPWRRAGYSLSGLCRADLIQCSRLSLSLNSCCFSHSRHLTFARIPRL